MKKKDVFNLIKYHIDKNENAFRDETINIARYFDSIGDYQLSEEIMGLLSIENMLRENISLADNSIELSPKDLYKIESPVKIGQKVYILRRNKIKCGFVSYIGIGNIVEFNVFVGRVPNTFKTYRFTEGDIGILVFIRKKDVKKEYLKWMKIKQMKQTLI